MGQPDGDYCRMLEDNKMIDRLAGERATLVLVLTAAWHALKSYEYGNSATGLAEEMCEKIESTAETLGINLYA
jgi:hypothetical protein